MVSTHVMMPTTDVKPPSKVVPSISWRTSSYAMQQIYFLFDFQTEYWLLIFVKFKRLYVDMLHFKLFNIKQTFI